MSKFARISLRKACPEDCEHLWRWRNDRAARLNSFQSRKISLRQHTQWFQKTLRDKHREIYMAIQNGNPAGVIRFDIHDKVIQVNINVNPPFRGKGLGKKMLKQASDLVRRRHPGCIQKALIKRANAASGNIFSKTGFIKIHEVGNPPHSLWIRL